MKKTHSFGVHFILRMNKVKNKRGPLYARVVVNGKRVEIALRKWIELDDWNDDRGVARGSRDAARETNHFIEEVRARLMQCYQELQLQRQLITAEAIKNKFLGSDENEHTLCKLIKYHNANMENSLAWGTQKNYFTTQKYIRLFLKSVRGTSDVYLTQLTYSFITDFEAYLRNYKPLDYHKPLANNGVMKHIERLRKMTNMALRMEWLEKDRFAKYQHKFDKVERGFLTKDELLNVETRQLSIARLQ